MNTESASSSDSTAFLPLAPAVKPPPPNDDYVGSDACANCHREIYDSYVKHPMYYSAGLVPGEHEVEAFDERAEFQPPGNRRYGVELTADQVIHHETMLDSQGQAIYDDAAVARIFIGSGTRGKSYGILRGDRLFESMISWYTSHGGSWGLSPGYLPATHQRFERPIADECMTCHAGRMVVGAAEDTFREPLFHEAAIGCERCHGPGQAHVARHEAGDGGEGGSGEGGNADDIVNPANLDPARRESICNQCHIPGKFSLPRYGRTAYDFRPGQLLDDAVTIMVEGTGVRDDGTTKSVSQVQQMRASACFLQSAGAFGCSSCHDPHSKPEPAAAEEFYRGRCLKCHEQRGCSLPEAERLRPPAADSCTHCHMPRISANDVAHTSQTDHRVVRRLQADVGGTARGSGTGSGSSTGHASSGGEWELFDHAERRLERWEVERVQGLALMARARGIALGSSSKLREAERLLRSAVRAAPDDVHMLRALGFLAAVDGRPQEGRDYLERAHEASPRDDMALQLLSTVCYQLNDIDSAVNYGERLLQVNPWRASDHARLSEVLLKQGELQRAIEQAEEALKFDPTLNPARNWIVQAYRQAGDDEAANRHADILRRINAAK